MSQTATRYLHFMFVLDRASFFLFFCVFHVCMCYFVCLFFNCQHQLVYDVVEKNIYKVDKYLIKMLAIYLQQ